MWTKILSIVPAVLDFLADKAQGHPKAALGATGGLAGLVGFLGSPELQATIRNGLADVLIAAADAIRSVPNGGG